MDMRAPRRITRSSALLCCFVALGQLCDGFVPARAALLRRNPGLRAGSGGEGGSADSDTIYAGLRARCEALRAEETETDPLAGLAHAWVVLFRGDDAGDGIHSLSSEGREIVLAFEAGAEAQRFALVLKAQGFYEPTPRKMDVSDLEAFCASDERISLLRVPEGTALVPPEDRVDDVEFAPRGAPGPAEDVDAGEQALDEARARLELLFQ